MLPPASTVVFYGEGGSGKTTLTIDLGFHLAAGVDWLGFEIARPVRVMLLENEGRSTSTGSRSDASSRPGTARASAAGWHPRGALGPRRPPRRRALEGLAEQLAAHEIDVLIAGPVRRLGLEGGGTPPRPSPTCILLDRVRTPPGVRRDRQRPPREQGRRHQRRVRGRVRHRRPGKADGKDRTQLDFRKSRWSSRIHRSRMTLAWVVANEGFAVVEATSTGRHRRRTQRRGSRRIRVDHRVRRRSTPGSLEARPRPPTTRRTATTDATSRAASSTPK